MAWLFLFWFHSLRPRRRGGLLDRATDKLSRSLDWLVIADHSDAMGFIQELKAGAQNILEFEEGKRWYDGLQKGGEHIVAATLDLITTFSQGKIPPELLADYSPGSKKDASVWKHVKTAIWTNTIGAYELGTVWTDPERAFYYARVIEIPTLR